MIDRWSADSDYRLNLESYGLEQLLIVVFGVPSAHVPARFFRVQDFGLMPRVQSMWTAKVQGTARAQNAVELGDHIPVAKQMLQHFKADDFIKCPSLVRQIVKIVLFEPQARRVCPFVNDQKVADWQVANEEEFSAPIPQEMTRRGGPLRITLKIPKATSPQALGMSADPRILGVACFDLQLVLKAG